MTKQKGQSFIEALIAFTLLIPFIIFLLSVSYLIYSKEITAYIQYRSLICTEELDKEFRDCEKEASRKLNALLFFHKNINTKLTLSTNQQVQIKTTGYFIGRKSVHLKKLKVVGP